MGPHRMFQKVLWDHTGCFRSDHETSLHDANRYTTRAFCPSMELQNVRSVLAQLDMRAAAYSQPNSSEARLEDCIRSSKGTRWCQSSHRYVLGYLDSKQKE